jgi:hypothetical protein
MPSFGPMSLARCDVGTTMRRIRCFLRRGYDAWLFHRQAIISFARSALAILIIIFMGITLWKKPPQGLTAGWMTLQDIWTDVTGLLSPYERQVRAVSALSLTCMSLYSLSHLLIRTDVRDRTAAWFEGLLFASLAWAAWNWR